MHSNSFVGSSSSSTGEALGKSVLGFVYIVGSTGFAVVFSGVTNVGFGVFGL